ncbi:DUF3054 domain-containing protein [Thermoflavimicrobium dichotomicum]|uniref:DUF3054 domain-containing protein n=1 Tax=Thermoflavimicrobium dichotomicum TaxID=46223 RepID=A0A1I3MI08_9BACL|nr:DUF3054 domain-containing protein [Thermoflavimicrobium dichotomicum]SFI96648.1 Protein of unknown function [Thermoflavimicrobium dichotomicum]
MNWTNRTQWVLIITEGMFFIAFSAIGRYFHGLILDVSSILYTAFPFILCWFIFASLFRLYSYPYQNSAFQTIWRTGFSVLSAITLGTWLRAVLSDHPFDWLFYQVTLAFFFIVFLIWRLLFHFIYNRKQIKSD